MFLLSFALSFASVALASPHHKRAGELVVELSGPSGSVNSADLVLTASITNTGSEDVKVLKYGTILDDLPTRSFVVTNDATQSQVPFTGVKLSVSMDNSPEAAYTTIASGQTVNVTHDVSAIYDFGETGKYTFTPISSFRAAAPGVSLADISSLSKVSADSSSIGVEISSVTKRELQSKHESRSSDVQVLDKRAVVSCSSSSESSFISASYTEGKALASLSSSYVSSNGASDSLYRSYFGSTATSTVIRVLNAVASESSSSRTLSCTDAYNVCDGNVIAYTVISTTDIYFCDIFFDEVPSTSLCSGTTVAARNVRGGTTLHELQLTHAVADTDDITYGCSADQALSDSQSAINADNYNCFTTQVYQNEEC
ncbi:Deuterolysin metalloprotease family-domain-containing protein [Desarmillaria tabescens]|uniref:Neutral protease 2 n=1 Tax=Armillaria tabescens TaxID=1929756 RepID=A0AA39MRV1_ARMTA|nr:Deuterolysin metalloprotease family-domain-containing protein [Desarmillaria tabescens]KAK0443943.1 Deuterolysin metalloprotease family-domain-containing protein [Desarmillaria tabescens]